MPSGTEKRKTEPPFSIRFTKEEREVLKTKSARKGLSEATLIRELVMGASVKGTRPPRVDAQAVGRLLAEFARWRDVLDRSTDLEERERAVVMLFELRTACLEALGMGD